MKRTLFVLIMMLCCIGVNAQQKINGHEYVDLGLSVKWATCNVGAKSPGDYGAYYTYEESLDIYWGGTWRMPIYAELNELSTKCTCTWTTQNGVKGYKVTGPNGNSIFLPAAGYRCVSSLYYSGSDGYYWSSTPSEDFDYIEFIGYLAYDFYFGSDYNFMFDEPRQNGLSVRPVLE